MTEQTDAAEQDDPLVGRTIDERYQVERLLGAGAMGAVYIVRHLRLGKRFAMKVIHGELAHIPEFVARFEQEAKACSFLSHPNCIAVTDFGRAKTDELYLVMEYVEGEALGDVVARGPLPVADALEITHEVLAGLEHAHSVDIIHRDMKLDNVMLLALGGRRVIKILDFGIAKVPVSSKDGKLTQAGIVFGTPEFMAPEQAVSAQVDARADLYAVGVMLWEMLLASAPIVADDHVALLNAKILTPAPRLEEVAPGCFSAVLGDFLARALEREPGKRFASAKEMLEALDAVVAIERTMASTFTPPAAVGEAGASDSSEVRASDSSEAGTIRSTAFVSVPKQGLGSRLATYAHATGQWVAQTTGGFWRCEDFPAQTPSWRLRARALVTTRRGGMILGGILGPIAMIVLIAILAGGSTPTADLVTLPPANAGHVRSGRGRPHAPAGIDPATEKRLVNVRLFLAKKACREAVLESKRLLREKPKLAGAHYLLAAAEVCRRHYRDALRAYAKAVAFDPRYGSDARLHEDLSRMLRYRKLRQPVLAFIDEKLGKAGRDYLATLVSTHARRVVRRAARRLLRARGAEGLIDETLALSKDLLQLSSCKKKRAIVEMLQKRGDPRALPALKRALKAKGGFLGLSHVNTCIARQLRAAIKALEAKKAGGAVKP
ncbi:MAG: serine/threonine protein kinase [Deltaproteobacteria bacterium]|nr:serine/threonine protein kinase [Deltaproteobacteria bacterium]